MPSTVLQATQSSDSELPLNLLSLLVTLKLLSDPLHLFAHALFALLALPLLVQGPALHDARDNLGGVDVLELVICNLTVDVEGLGDGVGIVCQRHEFGDAVVDGCGGGVREGEKESFGKGERRAEDDGVDIL
jgi:hypothetical protein